MKYLGVLIDEHLKWNCHTAYLSKKISRGIGILAKLRNYMELDLLKNVYYCLVFSHLSYGIHAWGSAYASHTNKFIILQKKAVRIMTGNRYFQIYGESAGPLPSSDPLFKQLEILKFGDIFKINLCKFVYETLYGYSPIVFADWFIYVHSVHLHSTRLSTTVNTENYFDVGTVKTSKSLATKKSKLVNYGAKMIQVSGPLLWNALPENIQESSSISTFKQAIKEHLIGNYG